MSTILLADWNQRGLIHQTTSQGLEVALEQSPLAAYVGFDPTATSLHVGSLLPVTMLMRLQRAGHRPIVVVGGGTGLIGDPSGKEAERQMLDRARIEQNVAGLRSQLERFLDFTGDHAAVLVNNADWLCELRLVDFLRDIGKHFSVNTMIARDSVKRRLETREQGISFTEFTYMLLQAYDFLVLHDQYGCTLQLGGSDQWGNIVAGVDLIRRERDVEVYGVTMPLISRSDGKKFGKSERGNIWLDPQLTTPFEFYQYWLNTPDADLVRLLMQFTFLSLGEIEEIARDLAADPSSRRAQREFARTMTRMVHGAESLHRIERLISVLFTNNDLRDIEMPDLRAALGSSPITPVKRAELAAGLLLVQSLVQTGLAESKARARELVSSGAISINHQRVDAVSRMLTHQDVLDGTFIVLRRGRKTYHLLTMED